MRLLVLLALVPALSFAEDDAGLEQVVEELVQQLGSPAPGERAAARRRLAAYGEGILTLLQRHSSDDPEVTRALRTLTAPARTVRIELSALAKPLPIGSVVELQVLLENNTDEAYALLPAEARSSPISPFVAHLDRSDAPSVAFRFDEVDWGPNPSEEILLRPGERIRVRLTIDHRSAILRRPAVCGISVSFRGTVRHGPGDPTVNGGDWTATDLRIVSDPVVIHVLGRRPEELEQALRSGDAALREAAVLELSLREDAAIAPLLRRHAREPALRLAAVRHLAKLGAAEDFELVMAATRDEDADVRRAAVLGLGSYPSAKARRRLGALVWDHELQAEAIKALRGHRHAATIDLFVGLLTAGNCGRESVQEIQAALYEWTGLLVDNRVAEVEAFKAWWEANRADWARAHASGR